MSTKKETFLKTPNINTEAILRKADSSPDMLTYQSSLSGNSYVIDKNGGVMILDSHGYYRAQWEDMQVICEELTAWILPEVQRWKKA